MTKRMLGEGDKSLPRLFRAEITHYAPDSAYLLWLVCGVQQFRIGEFDTLTDAKWMQRQMRIAIRENNKNVLGRRG